MFYPFNLSTLNSNTYLKHLNTTNSLPDNKFGQKGSQKGVLNDEKAEGMFCACHFKRIPYLRIHKTNEL